jgi:hypothetical protein
MPIGWVEKVTLQPVKAPVIKTVTGMSSTAADRVIVSSPL